MQKRRWLIITIIVLLIIIMLNPSMSNFKDYKGYNTYKGISKEKNFLLFSTFRDGDESHYYVGAFLNFFEMRQRSAVLELPTDTVPAAVPVTTTPESNLSDDNLKAYLIKKTNQTFTQRQLFLSGYDQIRITNDILAGMMIPTDISTVPPFLNAKIKLWALLANSDRTDVCYEKFADNYKSKDKATNLYYALKDEELYTRSLEEFLQKYFPEFLK